MLCLLLGSPLVSAQSWQILDEIDFAKNMARYRLFSLASDYLEQVGGQNLDGDDRLSLLYAKALVSRYGGDYSETADGRLNFYQASTDLYTEFLNKADPDHPRREEARRELATTHRNLGALRARMVQAGIDADNNKKAAETAFRECVKTLNTIFNESKADFDAYMEEADGLTEDQILAKTVEAYRPLSDIALAYYEWAQLYSPGEFNREDYFNKCIEAAEEFVWEVGTEPFISFRVYYYEALAYMKLGQLDQANTYLNFILNDETGLPIFFGPDDDPAELPQVFVNELTSLIELCYLAIAENHNSSKEYEKTTQAAEKLQAFYTRFKSRGVKPTDSGDEVMLELGMAEFLMGKPGGMPRVQRVAEAHPNDAIGTKAKEYISTILQGGTGDIATVIPPSIWMAGAETDLKDGKLMDSVDKYHRALGALDQIADEAERRTLALEAWNRIGSIYRGDGRLIEASLAFEQGLQIAAAMKDAEAVERLGVAWYNTLLARQRETKDKRDSRKKDEAMSRLAGMGIENMSFLVAKDDFEAARILPVDSADRKAAFQKALSGLNDVKKGDINYERALVYQARSSAEQGDFADALKKLEHLEKHIADPKNAPGADRKKIQAREIAHTETTYYRATYLAELGRHDEVLEALKEFEAKFASQDKFFRGVNYLRLRALLGKQPPRLAEAEALYAAKKEGLLPEVSGFYLAQAYIDVGNAEGTAEAQRKEYLKKGAGYLYAYCEASGFNSFRNLKAAADSYKAIGEWDQAIRVYAKLVDLYDGQAAYRDQIEQVVNLSMAESYLEKREFSSAAPLFKSLVKRFEGNKEILMKAGRCFGGWLDVTDGQCVEVPGSGDYKEAVEIWNTVLTKGFRPEDKFTPEWFEVKFFTLYSRYRARQIDPSYFTGAQQLMENLFTSTLNFYKDEEIPKVIGGQDWMRRYNYLRDRLR